MRKCYRNWNRTYGWGKLKFHRLEKYASDDLAPDYASLSLTCNQEYWCLHKMIIYLNCVLESSFSLFACFLSSCRKFELLLYHSSLAMVLQWHSTCHNQSTPLTGSQNQHQNLMTSTGLSFLHHLCKNGLLRL